jgi:site-specific DNA-methyltransferase (adenine-specific)
MIRIGDRVHVTNHTVEGLDRSWDGEVTAIDGALVRVTMPDQPRDYPFGWASVRQVTRIEDKPMTDSEDRSSKLNQLYTGDCVELLMDLEPRTIDVTLTSPPYNVGLKYDGYEDRLTELEFKQFNRSWLTALYRATKDSGRLYAIVSDKMIWWFREEAERLGWTYAQMLTWCKPNFVGDTQRMSEDWNHMTEFILLFRKGKRVPMQQGAGTTHNWFNYAVPQSNFREGRIHPAQLPLDLCKHIIGRTPGQVIADPFAGSASVLLAAHQLGRTYWGAELVEEVAARARERLVHTTMPMFNTQPVLMEVPKVKKSKRRARVAANAA